MVERVEPAGCPYRVDLRMRGDVTPGLDALHALTSVAPCVMCAYAIRLARIRAVVTGAQPGESRQALNGSTVLTTSELLPNRLTPAVIRGVLDTECEAVRREAKRQG